MRRVGRITDWNDERGFGFVAPNSGGARAFVHVKAFDRPGARPFDGALVSYEEGLDERRRLQARAVRFVDDLRPPRLATTGRVWWRSVVGVLAFVAWVVAARSLHWPQAVVPIVVVASLLAFAAYGRDKAAARAGRWRTPESTLHLLGLCGGWPGALIAQDLFRHKSRKPAFQIAFWITVVANVAITRWLLADAHWRLLLRHFAS